MFIKLLAALAAALVVATSAFSQEYSAGYSVSRIEDQSRNRPIQIDVWYPTTEHETERDYGFSVGHVAVDAAVTGDALPVVLLSPGAMGAPSNYSWIAEYLARRGYIVLGVSSFGESPVFGPDTVKPASVTHFRDRVEDLNFALEFVLTRSIYADETDPEHLAALGHSSGGASVLMLAGAEYSADQLAHYCASAAAESDRGCRYPADGTRQSVRRTPLKPTRKLKALVVLGPAVGPGFIESTLRALSIPTLVVGASHNDFLPYAFHAGRIASLIPGAEVVQLDEGEGHFVYLDECSSPLEVMGIPLCSDRQGVSRK